MLLSVIVPVYNAEKYLARCLDSILDQNLDFSNYEIILVNDGSKDKSLDVAFDYQKKYDHIKVHSQDNQGASAARNYGYNVSKGKYIYYIDSDDYIERNIFNNLLEILEKLNLDFIGFNVLRTHESNHNLSDNLSKLDFSLDGLKVYNGKDYIGKYNYNNSPCCYITRKEVIKNANLFFVKGNMVEDGIYTTELLLNCERAVYIDIKIYKYFINLNSVTSTKTKEHTLKMISDFKFIINKFNEILKIANGKNASYESVNRIKTRQQSYVFFLFVRLLKAQTSFKEFNIVINDLKKSNVYPIFNFIGIDYNSKKERILTTIFNNKLLLFFLIQFNSIFKVIK